jgi:glucokinase
MSLRVVLGLDFGGTKIAAATCDLSGRRLNTVVVDSLPEDGAAAAMKRGIEAGHDLLAAMGEEYRLVAVGAATFGIPFDNRVELAPSIDGWGSVPFGREIHGAFPGIPVRTVTDVKAAAAAELRWGALADCNPGIYLNLGTGLATAIVVGGAVVTGAHRAAGEIGYNLRSPDDVGLSLSDRVPLEDVVSGKALAVRASERLGRRTTTRQVFEMAATRPQAAEVVDEFIRELAMHVANLAVAIDPARIVVGGGMVRSWDRLEPGLRRALDAAVPFPPELKVAAFPFDAPLIGALAVGVEAAIEVERTPSALVDFNPSFGQHSEGQSR